jgi:KaiC/GvpD/RAD55 family RecA-like ATPase
VKILARIKSGIPGLDEMINNGFPENSVILIYGPPKCGKTIFSTQFLFSGLEQEEPSIYAITGLPLKQLKQMMRELGFTITPYEEKGFIFYIDLFTVQSGSAENAVDTEIVRNVLPHEMTEFMIAFSDGLKKLGTKALRVRVILDGLTEFVETNPEVLKRAAKVLIARCKQANATTLMTYTEGTADPRTETIFKSMVDGAIHLDGRGTMLVESMPMTPCPIELKYRITEKGVVVR